MMGSCLCLGFRVSLEPLRAGVCCRCERTQAFWDIRVRPQALSQEQRGDMNPHPHPVKNRKPDLLRLCTFVRIHQQFLQCRREGSWKKTFANQYVTRKRWRGLTSRAVGFPVRTHFELYFVFYFLGIYGYKWLCFWKPKVWWKFCSFLCNKRPLPECHQASKFLQNSGGKKTTLFNEDKLQFYTKRKQWKLYVSDVRRLPYVQTILPNF